MVLNVETVICAPLEPQEPSVYGIVSAKRGLTHVFSRFKKRSVKCPLHIASYALRIGISVMELDVN